MPSAPDKLRVQRRLVLAAHDCKICSRMCESRRVLTDLNGSWSAKIMFIAEAPGRLGAERTGIPLFGDRTGDRFDQILKVMDLRRSEVFITNAFRVPHGEEGDQVLGRICICGDNMRCAVLCCAVL